MRFSLGVGIIACLLGAVASVAGATELEDHLHLSHEVDTAGMSVLTGWGAVNVISGTAGWVSARDDTEWRSFHQMNLLFGAVNLGLAVNGLVGALNTSKDPTNVEAAYSESLAKQRFYTTMVGFDIVYITSGAMLWAFGGDHLDGRWKGYGRSLVLQGCALLFFDAAMALSHTRASRGLWAGPMTGPTLGVRVGGRF